MNTENILAWHSSLWRQIDSSIEKQRLAHAYLLQGAEGVGKKLFATQLAYKLLNENANASERGESKSGKLLAAGSHPDYRLIQSEAGKAIGIDTIRGISEFFSLTSQYGERKIAILVGAENMTLAASNALLKTLEEPPAGALLILISAQPSLLPITVRSRCQILRIPMPQVADVTQWLQSLGYSENAIQAILAAVRGAPLLAEKQLSGADNTGDNSQHVIEGARKLFSGQTSPVELSEAYLKLGAKQALYTLWHWHAEMLRGLAMNQTIDDTSLAQHLGQAKLLHHIDTLNLGIKRAESQLNEQLLLEDIFISWV